MINGIVLRNTVDTLDSMLVIYQLKPLKRILENLRAQYCDDNRQ